MPSDKPKTTKQPKLRSSCDACGAAKLKCDRGQPECGRCVSYGVPCVYGISRTMGKPPRNRIRLGQTPIEQTVAKTDTGLDNNDNTSSNNGGVTQDFGPFSSSSTDTCAVPWDVADKDTNDFMMGLDTLNDWFTDLSAPSIPNFSTLDFNGWAIIGNSNDNQLSTNLQFTPISQQDSFEFESYSSSRTTHQSQSDGSSHLGSSIMPRVGIDGHDCPREAYDILGSLSFANLSNDHSASLSSSLSGTSSASSARATAGVHFDRLLHLNREASERFGRLLNCTYAKSPQIALLFASIIFHILIWYRQAFNYTQSWSTSPCPTVTSNGSSTGSDSRSPPLAQSSGLDVEPATIAIGTFSVDDFRIQTAMKIQLLSGEMKRVGSLINQFTSGNSSGQCLADEPPGSVDSLYQSLNSWLKGEHSRITNMIRLKLMELNT